MGTTIQNKRLYIARFGAFQRTCEAYTGAGWKRLETARQVVLGTGDSRVHDLFDPAATLDPVTLRFICTRDDPFIKAAKEAAERHRLDPNSAEAIMLLAYDDAGAIVDTITLPRAVIQAVRFPEGDTNTSNETILEIETKPADSLS
jgi:hypothetical protein